MLKGMMFCERNRFSGDENVVTTVFSFRDKTMKIHNSKILNDPPFLGCVLDKAAAQELIQFLHGCLDEKKCDDCWNKEIPSCFANAQDLKCQKCGEFYK